VKCAFGEDVVRKSHLEAEVVSIADWMEKFYASLIERDRDKRTQLLRTIRTSGKNEKLYLQASTEERELLLAALKAVEEMDLARKRPRGTSRAA
jgi:hypothetical protein